MPNFARSTVFTGVVGGAFLFFGLGFGLAGCDVQRVAAAAQAKPNRLDAVLKQMDEASAKFQSAEADFSKVLYEKIVNDNTTQKGTIYFKRAGSATQMGATVDPPAAQTVEYKDGKLRLFNPGTNQIQEVSAAGSNQARMETFLTLGFGGSGSDLAKAWTIEDQGTEQMSDGSRTVTVEKLDLVSKESSVRGNFTHITIWVDPARGISLKQEFFMPSGDTQTAVYTNIRLNQPVDLKAFAIKCKGKCS